MPCVAEEGAGVCEHTDEVAQKTQVCQGDHLLFHAGLVVIEPPGRAVLDLAGDGAILEAADQCAQLCVVGRIQRIQDSSGALACHVQGGQKLRDIAAAGVLGDSVHTGVGTHRLEDPLIVVAQAGVMQLHYNVQPGVILAQMEKNYSLTLKASAALCPAAGKMISMIASGNAGSVKTLIGGEKINGKYPFYIDEEIPDNLYGLFVKAEDENGDPIGSEELSKAVKLGKYAVTIQSASGSRMDGQLILMLDEINAETVNTEELDHRIKSALDKAVFKGRMSREGGLDRIRYMAENHLPVNLIIRVCDQWQGETNTVKKKAMYVDPELKETVLAGEPGKVCDAIMNALAGTPMILKGPKSTGKNTLVNSVLYTLGYEMEYDVANADKVTADYMSHERTDNSAAEQVAKMRPEDLCAAEIAKAKAAAGLAMVDHFVQGHCVTSQSIL